MANKVLTFSNSTSTIATNQPTFLDVSMRAEQTYALGWEFGVQPVYLSDYFAFIGTDPDTGISAIMTEDSVVSYVELSDVVTSETYMQYVIEATNLSPLLRKELSSAIFKLSAANEDASQLTDDEQRLLVNNYDPEYFGIDLPDPLKILAVELKKGYAEAKRRYQMYLEKSKYKVGKHADIDAIQNSLTNIFTWTQGERILEPEFGTRLRQYLYNGITDENTEQIIAEIRSCVSRWEPRVQIESIVNATTTADVDDNTVHLEIVYSIPALSKKKYSYTYLYTYA